ncbi:tetratricopeptide repeat protein [Haloferula chungangensis]|uniref:Tetratricopeptide repeat protein n=1 Tax=Haloferula chungangensis TaxID=1048331 RepID=A0ABW2L642_9BACT
MRSRLFLLAAAALFASCGDDSDLPPMVSGGGVNNSYADALYEKAQAYEQQGKRKKAIKQYDKLADDVPLANKASEARYRQAKLLEEEGETLKAFDAYQELITRYQGSGHYQEALDAQSRMAFAAADGDIKNSFLGLKSKLAPDKIAGMLQKVADNAPRSALGARAEYKMGDIYAERKDINKAVLAYRGVVEGYPDSPLAPEAQFRIGEILMKQAQEGNQDQANLNRAREAFEDYLSQFPGHKRNAEARNLIKSLGSRDIKNTYDIAQFYEKKGNIASAKFYYQEVVRISKSGEYYDKSKARLDALGGN